MRKIYFLLMVGILLASCNKKDDSNESILPNKPDLMHIYIHQTGIVPDDESIQSPKCADLLLYDVMADSLFEHTCLLTEGEMVEHSIKSLVVGRLYRVVGLSYHYQQDPIITDSCLRHSFIKGTLHSGELMYACKEFTASRDLNTLDLHMETVTSNIKYVIKGEGDYVSCLFVYFKLGYIPADYSLYHGVGINEMGHDFNFYGYQITGDFKYNIFSSLKEGMVRNISVRVHDNALTEFCDVVFEDVPIKPGHTTTLYSTLYGEEMEVTCEKND